ncbi:hypothetical protein GCM10027445_38290 [Amycolatopsis endophytica]
MASSPAAADGRATAADQQDDQAASTFTNSPAAGISRAAGAMPGNQPGDRQPTLFGNRRAAGR